MCIRDRLSQLLQTWLDPLQALNPDGDPRSEIMGYVRRKLELSRSFPRESRPVSYTHLHAADSMDQAAGPVEGIGAYIDAKMEISRRHPDGSKVWE